MSNINAPVPSGNRSRRFRSASKNLRYVWLVTAGLVGGFSTFVIYDRFYHAVEVSQLLVLSVDAMNMNLPGESFMVDLVPKDRHAQKALARRRHNQEMETEQIHNRRKKKDTHQLIDDGKDHHRLKKEQVNTLLEAVEELRVSDKRHKVQQEPAVSKDNIEYPVDTSTVVRSLQEYQDERDKVYFLNETQVTQQDSFSASWLQSKEDFMSMNLDVVQICEDAAFKAWNSRREKLRMPLDYFDFSVEHMSKWWKLLFYHEHEVVYDSIMTKFGAYVKNGATDCPIPEDKTPVLGETVAVIAFQPYGMGGRLSKIKLYADRAHNLTIVSLAATLESLRRAEMGRVVVVGSDPSQEVFAAAAFDYLDQYLKIDPVGGIDMERKIGHMELAFAVATPDMTRTKRLEKNMPKGALLGARRAFQLADQSERTQEENEFLDTWFGRDHDPTYFKYLYLTEPDSILTTRTSSLPQIKQTIDNGFIVSPFRLQPIAHESDLRGYPYRDRMLPEGGGFETVLELDHYADSHDVCCDEHKMDFRPGKPPYFEVCGKKWFNCGFEEKTPSKDPHQRLRPYQLFRLKKGTGITMIGGNLFARRCFPGHNSVCRPPYVH